MHNFFFRLGCPYRQIWVGVRADPGQVWTSTQLKWSMVLPNFHLEIDNKTKYCQTVTFTYLNNTYSHHRRHSFDKFLACTLGSTCFLVLFSVYNLGSIAWPRISLLCFVDNSWIVYDSSIMLRHNSILGFYLKLRFFQNGLWGPCGPQNHLV